MLYASYISIVVNHKLDIFIFLYRKIKLDKNNCYFTNSLKPFIIISV